MLESADVWLSFSCNKNLQFFLKILNLNIQSNEYENILKWLDQFFVELLD